MYCTLSPLCFSFFFNDTAPTEIYTLSLHDALPISNPGPSRRRAQRAVRPLYARHGAAFHLRAGDPRRWNAAPCRSEEHTSELQSHSDLVCRLLLEKKKKKKKITDHQYHQITNYEDD